jgi:hypothetical protein
MAERVDGYYYIVSGFCSEARYVSAGMCINTSLSLLYSVIMAGAKREGNLPIT